MKVNEQASKNPVLTISQYITFHHFVNPKVSHVTSNKIDKKIENNID